MSKSSKKQIKKAVKVAKALAEAKTENKLSKAQEKIAKKAGKANPQVDSNERKLHEDGFFGGPGAQARARQRHFDSTGQTIVRHPGSMPDVPEDVDGVIS